MIISCCIFLGIIIGVSATSGAFVAQCAVIGRLRRERDAAVGRVRELARMIPAEGADG